MQGRESKVTRFGDAECGFDSFEIAHFSYEHHIRILTQSSSQSLRKSLRVGINLTLIHDAALMVVQKLDRIFDRENVLVPLFIDLVNYGGQSC